MEELRLLAEEAAKNPAVFFLRVGLHGILAAFMTYAMILPLLLSTQKKGS